MFSRLGHYVGEVIFALGVVVTHGLKQTKKVLSAHRHDTGIAEVIIALVGLAISILHNGFKPAALDRHQPPVLMWSRHPHTENGYGGLAIIVRRYI